MLFRNKNELDMRLEKMYHGISVSAGDKFKVLLIWMRKMDVGISSEPCSFVSFDYHVSIALNIRKPDIQRERKWQK